MLINNFFSKKFYLEKNFNFHQISPMDYITKLPHNNELKTYQTITKQTMFGS